MISLRIQQTFAGVAALIALAASAPLAAAQAPPALDYEFFKTRVAPIFLKSRSKDHARCYVCHQNHSGAAYQYLEELSPGASFWTDEQLRRIFANVSKLVTPGNPQQSRLVMHPLAPEAGGTSNTGLHSGGRQFESQDDPDWKTIVEWVNGAKAGR